MRLRERARDRAQENDADEMQVELTQHLIVEIDHLKYNL